MDQPINLQLDREDLTDVLNGACRAYSNAALSETECLISWFGGDETSMSRIDRALVTMIAAVNAIERLLFPGEAASRWILPPSAVGSGPAPAVRVQDPARESWDFRPWLCEKLNLLSQHTHLLVAEVQTTCYDLTNGMPFQKDRLDQMLYSLRSSMSAADAILSAIRDMGLIVVDWRLSPPTSKRN